MDNYIFGIRTVIEAITAGEEIDKVIIKKGLQGELATELLKIIRENKINFQFVPAEGIDRITKKNHQGVIAYISNISYYSIEEIIPQLYEQGLTPFVLVLEGITDVRNFGAIARSAECAGVNAIIIPTKGAAQVTADAIKTSAGALSHIKVCRTDNILKTTKFLKDSGIKIVAATEKGNTEFYNNNYKDPIAIVVGSEEFGISKELLRTADSLSKIPIQGKIASLNVSVAAAIFLFEVVKQRSND